MAANIPGYYYDPKKNRLFKIVEDHAASPTSTYTKSAVAKEYQKQMEVEKREKHCEQMKQTRVTCNFLLQGHPLGGPVYLQRELGTSRSQRNLASLSAAACVKGWERMTLVLHRRPSDPREPTRTIQHFIRDPGIGAIVYSMNSTNHDTHINFPKVMVPMYQRTVNGRKYLYGTAKPLGITPVPEISSLAISPSRVVLATGLGGNGQAPSVHMVRLVEPHFFSSATASVQPVPTSDAFMSNLNLPHIDQMVAAQISLQKATAIWSSSANPYAYDPLFAVGTSEGIRLLSLDRISFITSFPLLDWPDSEGRRDVLALDFWKPSLLIAGMRDGKLGLWDIRANGTTVRVQHPSAVGHVRGIDEHKFIVAGLKDKLSVYDTRFLKASPQTEQSNVVPLSEPLYTFPTYRKRESIYPRLGFDVHGDLVASGTEDRKVQIFHLPTGKELEAGSSIQPLNDNLMTNAMCLKFVDAGHHGLGLGLYVSNGMNVDVWTW